jgi:phosphate ABC transporter permease subunit PstA
MIADSHQRNPWFWLAALASALVLLAILALSYQMLSRGLSLFWPAELVEFQTSGQPTRVAGQVMAKQTLSAQQLAAAQLDLPAPATRILLQQGYQGNNEPTFRWYWQTQLHDWQTPDDLLLLRHQGLGDLYGRLESRHDGQVQLRLANGQILRLNETDIVLQLAPNALTLQEKVRWYLQQWWQFLSTEPREANSAGGIFPAIVGTLVSVLLMALLVAPIGILAGIYLHEYARDGRLVRLVRLSVHNLAGVPSVVFGVFGLGFFVYVLGGSIDQLFYSQQLPQPTFGTPGLIWVSLTLALLTLPVVIVATEQGLARIPASLRLGGYALGATQAEVLRKLILPAARPAMLTGIVLAVSRAAGEVAPLIFVGVVKYAPVLPVSSSAPYLQLDQQIMSLGFQIYDVGLQSSNADAAEPRVFAIALLLLALIGSLNLLAMRLRRYYQRRV